MHNKQKRKERKVFSLSSLFPLHVSPRWLHQSKGFLGYWLQVRNTATRRTNLLSVGSILLVLAHLPERDQIFSGEGGVSRARVLARNHVHEKLKPEQ